MSAVICRFLPFCRFCRWAGANCTAIFCHLCRFFVSIFFSFHARPVLTHEYFIYLLRCNFFSGVENEMGKMTFQRKQRRVFLKVFYLFFNCLYRKLIENSGEYSTLTRLSIGLGTLDFSSLFLRNSN